MEDGTKSSDHIVKKSRKQKEKDQPKLSKKRKAVEPDDEEISGEDDGLHLEDSIRKSMSKAAQKKLDKAMAKLEE